MNWDVRKEIKTGVLLFTVFNLLNFISDHLGADYSAIHFMLGMIAGLAFAHILVGILPEPVYVGLKKRKSRKCID